jgi:hypothetical protein
VIPDERAAALVEDAGAPLLWGLVAFIVLAVAALAGMLP